MKNVRIQHNNSFPAHRKHITYQLQRPTIDRSLETELFKT